MTKTSKLLEFHGTWNDYVGTAGNFTLNDHGSVTIRILTSGLNVPANALLNPQVKIDSTANFHFPLNWMNCTTTYALAPFRIRSRGSV
jgi:hypothetical protein